MRKLHDFPTKPIDSNEVTPRLRLKKKNSRTRVIERPEIAFEIQAERIKASRQIFPQPNSVGMNVEKNKSVITSK